MGANASQITSLTIVYSSVYSGANQRKHQSSVPLAFVRGIHRWPVNSLHTWPVTRKRFPFDDVIMMPAKWQWSNLLALITYVHWFRCLLCYTTLGALTLCHQLHWCKLAHHRRKLFYVDSNFTICLQGSNLEYTITGSNNGLASNRRHVII